MGDVHLGDVFFGNDGGFVDIVIPNSMRKRIGTDRCRLVLLLYAHRMDSNNETWVSNRRVADELHLDVGVVDCAVRVLEVNGWLIKVRNAKKGSRGTGYKVNTPKVSVLPRPTADWIERYESSQLETMRRDRLETLFGKGSGQLPGHSSEHSPGEVPVEDPVQSPAQPPEPAPDKQELELEHEREQTPSVTAEFTYEGVRSVFRAGSEGPARKRFEALRRDHSEDVIARGLFYLQLKDPKKFNISRPLSEILKFPELETLLTNVRELDLARQSSAPYGASEWSEGAATPPDPTSN